MSTWFTPEPEPKHRYAAMADTLRLESERGGTQLVLRAVATESDVDEEGFSYMCAELSEVTVGDLIETLQMHQRGMQRDRLLRQSKR